MGEGRTIITDKQNKVVRLLILTILAVLGGIAISEAYRKPVYPEVGSHIPNLSLRNLQGDRVKLSDYNGKVLVLHFWGSWCEPCAREMPTLQQAANDWKERNVEIVGINVGEDALVVENYRKTVQVHFTMLLDAKQEAVRAFGIQPLPTTFFIQPNGNVHAIHIGEVTASQLESYLQQMVKA